MVPPALSAQTATEYFKELVEEALSDRRVEAADLTEYYLVNLLCEFIRPDRRTDHQDRDDLLAVRLARALQAEGQEQRARLKSLGDFSLFMSGFFSDSFRRRVVDVDYYRAMGVYAYGSLSRAESDACAPVFGELAHKFVGFMDVLAHISERTALASSEVDLLRVYETWLRTGSVRDGRRLTNRGILPNLSIGRRFIQ